MRFRWKRDEGNGAAVAERPAFAGLIDTSVTTAEVFDEIEALSAANREARDPAREHRIVLLRHLAGIRLLDSPVTGARHPEPDIGSLPPAPGPSGLPEIDPGRLTPALLRAAILRYGSLLVRGMFDRDEALRLATEIDRAFVERDRHDEGETPDPGYYEEFEAEERFEAPMSRPWIKEGGGVLAADSPAVLFDAFEMFERAGLRKLVGGYLGERSAISAQKTTLRKADPSIRGAWHQDGAFMGEVRSLNLWLSLSRCGDEAPGLDIVPRRLDGIVATGGEGTFLSYQVSQEMAEQAAGETAIVRPIFEPGDALFFDELCLHQTGSDPRMPNPRFALESWFFGPSSFPGDYAPLAF